MPQLGQLPRRPRQVAPADAVCSAHASATPSLSTWRRPRRRPHLVHPQQVLGLGAALLAVAALAPRRRARVGRLEPRLGARHHLLAALQRALQQRAADRLVQSRQLLQGALAAALARWGGGAFQRVGQGGRRVGNRSGHEKRAGGRQQDRRVACAPGRAQPGTTTTRTLCCHSAPIAHLRSPWRERAPRRAPLRAR